MKKSVRFFVLLTLLTASLIVFGAFPGTVHSTSTLGDSTHTSYGVYIEASIDSLGEVDKYTFDDSQGDRWIEGEACGDKCYHCQRDMEWGDRLFYRDKASDIVYCVNSYYSYEIQEKTINHIR